MDADEDRGEVRMGLTVLGLAVGVLGYLGLDLVVPALLEVVSGSAVGAGPCALLLFTPCFVACGSGVLLGASLLVYAHVNTTGIRRLCRRLGAAVLLSIATLFAVVAILSLVEARSRARWPAWVFSASLLVAAHAFLTFAIKLLRRAAGRPATDRSRRQREVATASFLIAFVVGLAVFHAAVYAPVHPPHGHRRPECIQQVRDISTLLSVRSERRGWPPYGGKGFVLSLVATGIIDLRHPEQLTIFFCSHCDRDPPDADAYREITKETLATRRFPELTDFAGRRNDDPRYRLADDEQSEEEPIIACPCNPHGVLVGMASGFHRIFTHKELGLDPGEPIVFGDASPSLMLRKLSDQ